MVEKVVTMSEELYKLFETVVEKRNANKPRDQKLTIRVLS